MIWCIHNSQNNTKQHKRHKLTTFVEVALMNDSLLWSFFSCTHHGYSNGFHSPRHGHMLRLGPADCLHLGKRPMDHARHFTRPSSDLVCLRICAVYVCILYRECRECSVDLNGTSVTSIHCIHVLLLSQPCSSFQTLRRSVLHAAGGIPWLCCALLEASPSKVFHFWLEYWHEHDPCNCNLIAWPTFTRFTSLHLPLIKKYSFVNQKWISADVSFVLRWRSSCWIRTWWILIQSMPTHDTTFVASRTTLRVPAAQQPVVQRIWMTASSTCGTHGCTRRRDVVEVVKGTQPGHETLED